MSRSIKTFFSVFLFGISVTAHSFTVTNYTFAAHAVYAGMNNLNSIALIQPAIISSSGTLQPITTNVNASCGNWLKIDSIPIVGVGAGKSFQLSNNTQIVFDRNCNAVINGQDSAVEYFTTSAVNQLNQYKAALADYQTRIANLEKTISQFTDSFNSKIKADIDANVDSAVKLYQDSVYKSIDNTIQSKLADSDIVKTAVESSLTDEQLGKIIKASREKSRQAHLADMSLPQGTFYIKKIEIDEQNRTRIYPAYVFMPDDCNRVSVDWFYVNPNDTSLTSILNAELQAAYANDQKVTVEASHVTDPHLGDTCMIDSVQL